MPYGDTLAALADPTRRAVFERLRRRDHAVGELADALRITQPAVSQHLRVLLDARLVTRRIDGSKRIYRADPAGLADLRKYIEGFWDDVLAAFAKDDPAPPRRAARIIERKRKRNRHD